MENAGLIVAQQHEETPGAQQQWRRLLEFMALATRHKLRAGPAATTVARPDDEHVTIVWHVGEREDDLAIGKLYAAPHAVAAAERRRVDPDGAREAAPAVI